MDESLSLSLSLSLWVDYHSRISPWKVLRVGVSEAAMVGALHIIIIVDRWYYLCSRFWRELHNMAMARPFVLIPLQ